MDFVISDFNVFNIKLPDSYCYLDPNGGGHDECFFF